MKKTKLLIAAGLLALFSSCGDTALDAGDSSDSLIQPTAKLSIIVRDIETTKALQGVKAELLAAGKTGTTDANGIVTFEDVYSGSYIVQLTKTDYATMIYTLKTESASTREEYVCDPSCDYEEVEIGGVYIAGNKTDVIDMYPTSASYEGYLSYQNTETTTVPAGGAWVYIQLAGKFFNKTDSVQVGPDGKYTFTNLPAGSSVVKRIYTKPFDVGGKTFVSVQIAGSTSLNAGVPTYKSSKTILTEVAGPKPPFGLVSQPSYVSQSGIIWLEFNEDIASGSASCNLIGIYYDEAYCSSLLYDNKSDCETNSETWYEEDYDEFDVPSLYYNYSYDSELGIQAMNNWNYGAGTHDYYLLSGSCSVYSINGSFLDVSLDEIYIDIY